MMTSEEYIERVLAIGYDVHCNDQIWWIERSPFFYEPVVPLQVLKRGAAKPKTYKSLLGYSHLVSSEKDSNACTSVMLLREEQLKNYSMQSLSSKRRNKVRKGLRLTKNIKIESIENVLDDMKQIAISKAIRTGRGKSPEYYVTHYEEWKADIIKQFNIDKGKKEYWGSFYNGNLIAFMTVVPINGTMMINQGSSHTDHLDKCPNDALRYTFLEYCKTVKECQQVISGLWSDNKPTLNEFKESYGFEKVDLPLYIRDNFPMLRKLLMMKQLRLIKNIVMSYIIHKKK
ncbi:hypothetical protein C4544_04265 [candidate division WS5 bacterium]|uniref:Uncharacterized protein n=1 Tax=candidate division WS5 bacterium TaxID=2093353 RepID=A0A419DCI8_9BACT|nr:MAG: hypothetical protein C4544_04265 [candidate division WS5 bacterium]